MKSVRLKNFCEICRKQCRDQNGYHCHLNSISHQKKIRDFIANPDEQIDKYSNEMESRFVQILKVKYPGEIKDLEDMYEEYLQNERAVKLNHTKWKNIEEFAEHMKGVRNVQVQGKINNWKISYQVNKTSQFIMENKKKHLQKARQREKEQLEHNLQKKIEKKQMAQQRENQELAEKLQRQTEQRKNMRMPETIEMNINNFMGHNKRTALLPTEELEREIKYSQKQDTEKCKNVQKLFEQISKIEQKNELIEQDEQQWIVPEIIVKIKPHEIDEIFHYKKGSIKKVIEPYVAQVQVGTAIIHIDQVYLQTVIPKPPHKVIIVKGEHKGKQGQLQSITIQSGFGQIFVGSKSLKIGFNNFSKCT